MDSKNLFGQFDRILALMELYFPYILLWILLLWAIHIMNYLMGYRLNILGILPRHPFGLAGIFFAPFLHGNFDHLFFNSIPLFALGSMVMLQGPLNFLIVTVFITIVSGFATWLFGRRGLHIGASGLIMGYFGYLLTHAYYDPSLITIITLIMSLYYFGGLIGDLFPGKIVVSWEGHVFGFISGIAVVLLWPQVILIATWMVRRWY
jgi:membrane associated rhomboid family serine protease